MPTDNKLGRWAKERCLITGSRDRAEKLGFKREMMLCDIRYCIGNSRTRLQVGSSLTERNPPEFLNPPAISGSQVAIPVVFYYR